VAKTDLVHGQINVRPRRRRSCVGAADSVGIDSNRVVSPSRSVRAASASTIPALAASSAARHTHHEGEAEYSHVTEPVMLGETPLH